MPFPAGSYPARVVADGAVAYWRLGETSGTTANDSVGTAHGTISGGVTLGQPGPLADGTKAMLFDGISGQMQTPALTIPAVCSIEAWIKTSLTGQLGFVSNRVSGVAGEFLVGVLNAQVWITTNDEPASIYSTPTAALNNSVWHHVVWTSDGTNGRIYVDGAGNPGTPQAHVHTAKTQLVRLGRDEFQGYFPGTLADVAIYPTALTAPQIAAHYAARTFALLPTIPWAVVGGAVPGWAFGGR